MTKQRFMTIERHIIDMERKHPGATGQLSSLLADLSIAAKVISLEVNKAGLVDILGFAGTTNVHGEDVKKLDIFAHETILHAMQHRGYLAVMASEEDEEIIHVPQGMKFGKYVLLFDPLDGSANIDANVSIGTIFSIYKRVSPEGKAGNIEDCLQPGIKQVAAGYIVYGSSTILVYTTGDKVYSFTLDPSFGEFLLSREDIKMPKKGKIYSLNEGNSNYFSNGIKNYLNHIHTSTIDGKPYSARYIGSMVADIHRTLLYGGIFMYPADTRHPNGKLRLMYECNPTAFIIEAAGGRATTGTQRLLEIQPEKLHQRVPIFAGSEEDVLLVEKFLAEDKKA